MAEDFSLRSPFARIALLGDEESFPTLREVANFLYDFNLVYEMTRLAVDKRYADFRFSNNVFYRNGRPLEDGDLLHVEKLVKASPIEINVTLQFTGIGLDGFVAAVVGTATLITTLK